MFLKTKEVIRTETKFITYETFKQTLYPLTKKIFASTTSEKLQHFLGESVEIVTPENTLSDNIKNVREKYFNCLSANDDILFFDEKECFLCSIPYNFFDIFHCFVELQNTIDSIEHETTKQVFHHIIFYYMTKNLKYIHQIINTHTKLSPHIFKILSLITNKETPEQIYYFHQILNLLTEEKSANESSQSLTIQKKALETQQSVNMTNAIEKIETNKTTKNLIVFHLESISNQIYMNNRPYFENLTQLMNQSICFDKFYTSASSSIMSLYDFFYGNDFEIENYSRYGALYHDKPINTHLYEELRQNGYEVLGIGFNDAPQGEEVNRTKLWNVEGQQYIWITDFDQFIEKVIIFIQQCKEKNKPFAIHLWDLLPHSGHYNDETKQTSTYAEKTVLSYISVDIMIKKIMDCLEETGLDQNTIVAGYGDHGDDMWTRDMNYGFTHVTAPHRNLIWTPAFICDKSITPFLLSDMASMIDLKYTLFYMMGIKSHDHFTYQGINLLKQKNTFTYSRSLLFNQSETEKIGAYAMIRLNGFSNIEFKNKSFAIYSDDYNFIVSNNGVELYQNSTDPFNYNNLLSFIKFDENFIPIQFDNLKAWRGHFRNILMREYQIYEILLNYEILKNELINRIETKTSMIENEEKHLFDMKLFNKVSPRGFIFE